MSRNVNKVQWFIRLPKRIAKGLIRGYQLVISPIIPPCCRFYPSCSQYALEAIQVHGLLKGIWLGTKRIFKCHPFHPGGVDLVPPLHSGNKEKTDVAS